MSSSRVWRLDHHLDLYSTLSALRRGPGDPTWHDVGGAVWKAWRTPSGPVTACFRVVPGGAEAEAIAWGPGADWLVSRAPEVLGGSDDPRGFRPAHPVLAQAWRRCGGWRVPRTGLVMESLAPSILEQKVTGVEAFRAYRRLVLRHGEPAPAGVGAPTLWLAPSPLAWRAIPSWEWVQAGVDGRRSGTLLRAAAAAERLEQAAGMAAGPARARLEAVPGVGGWTSAEVAHTALGDPDAVSFGDFHVARDVGFALTGHPTDDAGMADLLAPYLGHRYRVQRLVELAGIRAPRRGPRRALRAWPPP